MYIAGSKTGSQPINFIRLIYLLSLRKAKDLASKLFFSRLIKNEDEGDILRDNIIEMFHYNLSTHFKISNVHIQKS